MLLIGGVVGFMSGVLLMLFLLRLRVPEDRPDDVNIGIVAFGGTAALVQPPTRRQLTTTPRPSVRSTTPSPPTTVSRAPS